MTDTIITKLKVDKGTNNTLQSITQKTKDRATQTPLKTRVHPGVQEL